MVKLVVRDEFKSWKELESYKKNLQASKKVLLKVIRERRVLNRQQLVYNRASPFMKDLRFKRAEEERLVAQILKDIDNGDRD